jgi:hypothetical protein
MVVIVVWLVLRSPFPSSPDNLFSAAASVASVFASFLGVAQAIVLTIKDSDAFKVLRDRGYANELFSYLRDGIYASIVFASLSIIGFFVDKETIYGGVRLYKVFSMAWIATGCLSVFMYLRISNILFKLLRLS